MSNVVQFPSVEARREQTRREDFNEYIKTRAEIRKERYANSPAATVTEKNYRLRLGRREIWRTAEAATRYWKAKIEFDSACETAQERGIQDSLALSTDDRMINVRKWRQAVVNQLLTPAPDAASLTWKRQAFAQGEHEHIGTKPKRIERAIADDVEWLAAHPFRRSNSEAVEKRREFKAVMRRRIKDIAASRDLSDDEIKPAMTLKHHELAKFTDKHGVNPEWLLEGTGRIFKKDPIVLGPNMRGAELAAVVRTLPETQQQIIEATVDRLLKERGLL